MCRPSKNSENNPTFYINIFNYETMSRNIKDWTIKEPVKGNHYKLWRLLPGSVFTISTPSGTDTLLVNKQRGTLTYCQIFDKGEFTAIDSSLIVTSVA